MQEFAASHHGILTTEELAALGYSPSGVLAGFRVASWFGSTLLFIGCPQSNLPGSNLYTQHPNGSVPRLWHPIEPPPSFGSSEM
jgi:hypothetical protein